MNGWRVDDLNSKNTNQEVDDYNQFYGTYRSKWWRVLCLNAGKEAKERQQTENIRDLWTNQIEFFLSCLGFIVGVGNTLRFPSMIYQHGGGRTTFVLLHVEEFQVYFSFHISYV